MRRVEIVIDGVVLGCLDPEVVTLRQQMELEEQATLIGVVRWLETYAEGDRDTILAAFDRLTLSDFPALLLALNSALAEAVTVPNGSAPASAAPARPAGRARPGGPSASATPPTGTVPRGKSPRRLPSG